MRNITLLALATTFALQVASAAIAGEGSPDVALPSASSHDGDPTGSSYPTESNGYTFGPAVSGPQVRGNAARVRRSDDNVGALVRQHQYEDQNGINGE